MRSSLSSQFCLEVMEREAGRWWSWSVQQSKAPISAGLREAPSSSFPLMCPLWDLWQPHRCGQNSDRHQWKGLLRSQSPTEVPRGAGVSWGLRLPGGFLPCEGAGCSNSAPGKCPHGWKRLRCCCCWPHRVQDKGLDFVRAAELGALV